MPIKILPDKNDSVDFLAIAAHPDDVELCCAGTLAKLAKSGYKTAVLDLTNGEMGTRGTPELRLEEASDAGKILGLAGRYNLGLPDAALTNSDAHRIAIISAVRTLRPAVCFINAQTDRHPDHGNAHKLTKDALFYGGLKKILTKDEQGNVQQPWRPNHVLMYMQDSPFEPDLVFDISETMAHKEKAILAFKSQFNVPENDDGPKTYISGSGFFEMIRSRARIFGHQIGVEYGEPFNYLNGPVPFTSFDGFMKHKPAR